MVQFLDPETTEILPFLDPEIVKMVRFLDPEIVEKVDKSFMRKSQHTIYLTFRGSTKAAKLLGVLKAPPPMSNRVKAI